MKICFYCDTIFSFGGVQRVLAVIAKSLSEEHDITILTMDPKTLEDMSIYNLDESNIHIEYIAYPPISKIEFFPFKLYSFLYKEILPQTKFLSHLYGYSSFPPSQRSQLIRVLNEKEYDIIIGVHAFLSLRLASIRKKLNAKKVIGWLHTSYDAFFNTPGFYLWKQKQQFRFEIPLLDEIIVLSRTDQQLFKKNLNIRSTVIYNPLTLHIQEKCSIYAKKFLTIGRMSYKTKGFDILIKAFAEFAKDHRDWTLDIVGEGHEETMLRELISTYKLKDRITIYPFTKNIQKHYESASVYILSSRWEGFPLVLAEAMSHSLPIIAANIPVVMELLDKKENCLLFEKENIEDLALKMAQITQKDLKKMGSESHKVSEKLQIHKIIGQWNNLLEEQ